MLSAAAEFPMEDLSAWLPNPLTCVTHAASATKCKIGEACRGTPRKSARVGSPPRRSFLDKSAGGILAATGLLGTYIADQAQPVEQPAVLEQTVAYDPNGSAIPPPYADMDELMRMSPATLTKFLAQNGHNEGISFWQFFVTYREPPTTLQTKDWKGPCNNFSEFFCEWGAHQGHPTYLVNMYPKHFFNRFGKDWHQIAAICIATDQEYLIADNNRVTHWQGSLDEYITSHWPSHKILPVCGIHRWVRTKEGIVPRMLYQIGHNEKMAESPVPLNPPTEFIAANY